MRRYCSSDSVVGAEGSHNSDYREQLHSQIENILNQHFDWAVLAPRLQERRERLDVAITTTDAADAETVLGQSECSQTYNPEEIDGDSKTFCDVNRASIKRFVEARRETLFEEILQQ